MGGQYKDPGLLLLNHSLLVKISHLGCHHLQGGYLTRINYYQMIFWVKNFMYLFSMINPTMTLILECQANYFLEIAHQVKNI
jgi:hypothetical protein